MIAGGTKTANAVGGKTARACDSCVRKRARWYCAADDAFLCHTCDASVHSANQLAGRHERVLLETTTASSNYKLFASSGEPSPEPTWHQGLTRKARTPRRQRTNKCSPLKLEGAANSISVRLVPEMDVLEASLLDDDDDDDDDDEQLLYRVPVFDPFETELCNASNELAAGRRRLSTFIVEEERCNLDDVDHRFDDHDLDLMEFAADVESLLGKGFDDTSCRNIDDLGLANSCNYKEEYDNNTNINIGMICFEEHRSAVKVEDKEEVEAAMLGFDLDDASGGRETLVLNCDSFDYEHTKMIKEEEGDEKRVVNDEEEEDMMMMMVHSRKSSSSIISLRLNYEDVINTWGDQDSPWTNGIRPQVNSDGFCWPDSMESWWVGNKTTNPSSYGRSGDDGGRKERVRRYREKRRRRLFSKKIRYQVRKLNAEKRPRMKGRFVKRETTTC